MTRDEQDKAITRDALVEALRLHRGEIVEADEWRPLADHVLELVQAGLLAARQPPGEPCDPAPNQSGTDPASQLQMDRRDIYGNQPYCGYGHAVCIYRHSPCCTTCPAARQPPGEPFPHNRICRPAPYPQATPPAPCPECRDRPGHIAIDGQEVPCNTCGRMYAPRAPQRFWRIHTAYGSEGFITWVCDAKGKNLERLTPVTGPRCKGHNTRAEAEADGKASGLPAWPAEVKP